MFRCDKKPTRICEKSSNLESVNTVEHMTPEVQSYSTDVRDVLEVNDKPECKVRSCGVTNGCNYTPNCTVVQHFACYQISMAYDKCRFVLWNMGLQPFFLPFSIDIWKIPFCVVPSSRTQSRNRACGWVTKFNDKCWKKQLLLKKNFRCNGYFYLIKVCSRDVVMT